MSKLAGKILDTYIGAPLEIVYRIDLARQRTESVLDISYLLIRRVILELEQHNVSQDLRRLFGTLRASSVIRSFL